MARHQVGTNRSDSSPTISESQSCVRTIGKWSRCFSVPRRQWTIFLINSAFLKKRSTALARGISLESQLTQDCLFLHVEQSNSLHADSVSGDGRRRFSKYPIIRFQQESAERTREVEISRSRCDNGRWTVGTGHNEFPLTVKHPGCFGAAGVLRSGSH
jgi:hypothetical protein